MAGEQIPFDFQRLNLNENKFPRSPENAERKISVDNHYCFCKMPSRGFMICCSNKKCQRIFHLSCVKLLEFPKGDWFCSHCRLSDKYPNLIKKSLRPCNGGDGDNEFEEEEAGDHLPIQRKGEEIVCFCQRPSFGEMIECCNDFCPRGLFHVDCVKVKRKQTGNWYCRECRLFEDAPSLCKPSEILIKQLDDFMLKHI